MTTTRIENSDKSDGEAQSVRQVIEAYAERLRANDVAGIVDLYTEDAAVMGPDMPTAVGHERLDTVYRAALDAVAMDFTFSFDEVSIRGDTAIARTRTDGSNTVRATGDRVPGRYRELFVLSRQDSGWKIARYMFQPRPEEEP